MAAENSINIRQAMKEDAELIHTMVQELDNALGHTGKSVGTVEDFTRFGFDENAFFNALIAEHESDVLGMCTYFPIFSTWGGRPGIFVQDLYVREMARGSGLGEILLARLADMSQQKGGTFLRLSVDNHNIRGQKFYDRLGFDTLDDERSCQLESKNFKTLAAQVRGNR